MKYVVITAFVAAALAGCSPKPQVHEVMRSEGHNGFMISQSTFYSDKGSHRTIRCWNVDGGFDCIRMDSIISDDIDLVEIDRFQSDVEPTINHVVGYENKFNCKLSGKPAFGETSEYRHITQEIYLHGSKVKEHSDIIDYPSQTDKTLKAGFFKELAENEGKHELYNSYFNCRYLMDSFNSGSHNVLLTTLFDYQKLISE